MRTPSSIPESHIEALAQGGVQATEAKPAVKPVVIDLLSLRPGQTVEIPTAMCSYSVTVTDHTREVEGGVRGVIITATRRFAPAMEPAGSVVVDRYVTQGRIYQMGSVHRGGSTERIRTALVGVPRLVPSAPRGSSA